MIRKHAHEIWHLEQSVEINSEQIGKRNEALNNYKMLVYNLSEVLLVQPEIPSPDYIRQMP